MLADNTDTVAETAEQLASGVHDLLLALDTPDAAAVPLAARAQASRDLASAAARLRHAAQRLEVAAAGLVDVQRVHLLDVERTPRTWLARHTGISHREASELVRGGTTCARFPEVAEAFFAGDITLGHLDATGNIIPARFKGPRLDEAVEKVRNVQNVLVETAKNCTIEEYTQFCERVRDRLDLDGPKDKSAEPSRVWLHRLFNGRWSLSGDLSADDGALIATILADIRARRAREARNDAGDAARSEPGEATDESSDDGADVGSLTDKLRHLARGDEIDTAPTYSELQAQDLLALFLAGAGAKRPGRVGIYLHINLDDLNAPVDEGIEDVIAGRRTAHTGAGLDITDETLWGLMAKADITPIFSRKGRSLWYGRTRRLAPAELRRVLAHRDRRCRVPGCNRPPINCEAHHIDHWPDGGTTDPKTCALTCKHHHDQHHNGGLGISGDADGVLEFTRPDGTPLDIEPLYKRNRRKAG